LKLNYITLAIVTVAVVFLVVRFWGPPWTAQRISGLVVAIPCCILLGIARVQLGRAFSVRAKATILVTHGIYSRIRNPIYIFGSPAIMGLALWANKPSIWPLFLVVIPLQIYRARKESKVLEQHFGAAYIEYKRQTWF
jgi:protein-S-isoprenylcysteine O-methyltransferase Ste14